jgi:peptide/nickel transport system ATP-binding protein
MAATSPLEKVLLRVEHLTVEFAAGRKGRLQAVSDVSFDLLEGETLGIVGESGCGKSSTARAIIQAPRPTSGAVVFDGVDLTKLRDEELRQIRPKLQFIFQDPISALNPRRTVSKIVAEPLDLWHRGSKESRRQKVAHALESVGLDLDAVGNRRPFEFSGGQCQRISIARALVMEPEVLICDEPVSALDVSIRAQILAVLEKAKAEHGLTMVFVGHDLAVVKNISDRIAVMYLGKLCEIAPADELHVAPRHPYTAGLHASVLEVGVDARSSGVALEGDLPSPLDPPSGCRFRTRCPRAQERCAVEEPPLRQLSPAHLAACHFPLPVPVQVPVGRPPSGGPDPDVPVTAAKVQLSNRSVC